MTEPIAAVVDPEAELRWRAWQARGAEGDRRATKRMRGLALLLATGILVWFASQFV